MNPVFVRSLLLSNIRSHCDLDIHLGPGLTILVGPNGAGKTTILEAIALVLRGGMLRPGHLQDLVSLGKDHLRAEIELEVHTNYASTQTALSLTSKNTSEDV